MLSQSPKGSVTQTQTDKDAHTHTPEEDGVAGEGGGGQGLTEGQSTEDSLEHNGSVECGGGQGGGGIQAAGGHGGGGHGTVVVGEAQPASGAVGVNWCT